MERPCRNAGKTARQHGHDDRLIRNDAGSWALIAGPALGYFLGSLAARRWGHTPAFEAGGAMLGLAAAARQIWLLLSRR